MRTAVLCLLVLLATSSCTKPTNDNPTPPIDSIQGERTNNFGKMIEMKDTLTVYDATKGTIIVQSDPYGVPFRAAINNTTVNDSLVYQPTATRILAMNYKTGQPQFIKYFSPTGYWPGGVSTSFPIFDGLNLYQVAYNPNGVLKVFCINKTNGNTIWESDAAISYDQLMFSFHIPSLAQTAKNIFVNTYDGPACFEKSSGKLIWRNNSNSEFAYLNVQPVIANDQMLIATSPRNKALYAFDLKDGTLLWKLDLKVAPLDLTLHVYDNKLYVVSDDSGVWTSMGYDIYCLDINSGTIINKMSYPEAYWFIYFYESHFYTFNKTQQTFFPQRINKHLLSTGAIVWSRDMEGGTYDGFTCTPDFIYCTEVYPINTGGWQRMNILSQKDGKTLKQFPIDSYLTRSPVVVDSLGRVYAPVRWWLPTL